MAPEEKNGKVPHRLPPGYIKKDFQLMASLLLQGRVLCRKAPGCFICYGGLIRKKKKKLSLVYAGIPVEIEVSMGVITISSLSEVTMVSSL